MTLAEEEVSKVTRKYRMESGLVVPHAGEFEVSLGSIRCEPLSQ